MLGSIRTGMLGLALWTALPASAALAEETWVSLLRQALAAERKCALKEVLWYRELPLGSGVSLDGRASCWDGREFDFSRPREHQRFQFVLCQPTVC